MVINIVSQSIRLTHYISIFCSMNHYDCLVVVSEIVTRTARHRKNKNNTNTKIIFRHSQLTFVLYKTICVMLMEALPSPCLINYVGLLITWPINIGLFEIYVR
jgi:hypothetical protein